MQSYKSVYFPDRRPTTSGRRSPLTLAFGRSDAHVFSAVRDLSSYTLRRALGYDSFAALQQAARDQGTPLNTFCLSILREHLNAREGDSTQSYLPGLSRADPLPMNHIQATFNGGRDEPLHDWYPYLEGYSPAFVETVLARFCPDADSVLDPFSGTGTTPLTASRLGKTAYFAEINPVLQFLTACKVDALQMRDKHRETTQSEITDVSESLDRRLAESNPDERLRKTHSEVFRRSKFFDDDTFESVLRVRTLIDDVAPTHPIVARFLTIAVLRSLIPASLLIRRGDLRFRKEKELARHSPDFSMSVRNALIRIRDDLGSVTPTAQVPTLLVENAKNLARLPPLALDAVITSPPYLNGTNYIRNTKVELWFLRFLNQREDLARFRFGAMTAGINDVTVKKTVRELPPAVESVVARLDQKAYDSRIPRMVACFASEMHGMIQALGTHTHRRSTVVIDIGDSAYAGVHVPTDRFITESFAGAGFDLEHEIVLRERFSRSRTKLAQKLLVYRPAGARPKRGGSSTRRAKTWTTKWRRFKDALPHQKGDYAKRNWGHPLHSLCSYQGKMKPSLAAHLVRTFSCSGDRMLDPFGGVGTIPFEGAMHGVRTWSFDISPPAVHIAAAKTGRFTESECEDALARLEARVLRDDANPDDVASAEAIAFNGPIALYFHEKTLREILVSRRYFLENPPTNASESLVLSCLVHILHGNRPYALSRRSHPITPFAPSGETEYRALIPRLRQKLTRSLSTPRPSGFEYGHSLFQDATEWWPAEVEQLDAVITSPPFFNSTRFHLGNWMRLWFCGWERADFRLRPKTFVDERQRRGFGVYAAVLRQCRERLRSGGVVVFHLGASKKCDMAEELARISKRWFRIADVYTESVSHCESHGIRDKGTVASHQYLVLE